MLWTHLCGSSVAFFSVDASQGMKLWEHMHGADIITRFLEGLRNLLLCGRSFTAESGSETPLHISQKAGAPSGGCSASEQRHHTGHCPLYPHTINALHIHNPPWYNRTLVFLVYLRFTVKYNLSFLWTPPQLCSHLVRSTTLGGLMDAMCLCL